MDERERNELVKEIKSFISTETKEQPQSVIFRSGMNTGLRLAARIVDGYGKEEHADRV